MSRQLDQLEILQNKLSHRYGSADTLCRQVSAALERCRKFEPAVSEKRDWSVSYARTVAAHRLETFQKSHH